MRPKPRYGWWGKSHSDEFQAGVRVRYTGNRTRKPPFPGQGDAGEALARRRVCPTPSKPIFIDGWLVQWEFGAQTICPEGSMEVIDEATP